MKNILATTFVLPFLFTTSIYSFTINNIDEGDIMFNNFHGKKILLVNIATNSSRVDQLGQLQQLHEQHPNLVIIGFPSNSFGNESRSNSEIKSFCGESYGVTYLLAAK